MKNNIRITLEKQKIINLWHNVFGDDEKYITYFLNECKNKNCLGYFVDDELVSMLFLIDCKYMNHSGKYIYAVATDENFRNQGYASLLVNEAKKYMNDFLWLIPANEKLFDFYAKLGFETKLYSSSNYKNKITFNESPSIVDDLYDGSSFEFPKGMIYSLKNLPVGDTGMIMRGE